MDGDVLGGFQMLVGNLPDSGSYEAVAVVVTGAGIGCRYKAESPCAVTVAGLFKQLAAGGLLR